MTSWSIANPAPAHADAETLRWVVRELRRHLQATSEGDARKHLGGMILQCNAQADVADTRKPDLVDWISAAVRSKLGTPKAAADGATLLIFYWDHGARVEIGAEGGWCANIRRDEYGDWVTCKTPGVLLFELDALAERGW